MATKFTENEAATIAAKLKEAAIRRSSTIGMRKTTVEELCTEAGISKGAFYKFYDTKEALFFEVLEDWHDKVYGQAHRIMEASKALPDKERAYNALLYTCQTLDQYGLVNFYENDMPLLLRKIPQVVLDAHYHSDEEHIADLVKSSGIELKVPSELASATVRALILTLSHRGHIGSLYPQVMELLIRSVCDSVIA